METKERFLEAFFALNCPKLVTLEEFSKWRSRAEAQGYEIDAEQGVHPDTGWMILAVGLPQQVRKPCDLMMLEADIISEHEKGPS